MKRKSGNKMKYDYKATEMFKGLFDVATPEECEKEFGIALEDTEVVDYVKSECETVTIGDKKLWLEPMLEDGYSFLQLNKPFNKDEWTEGGFVFVELLDATNDDILVCGEPFNLDATIQEIYDYMIERC